jgi:hypothetical protein
MMKLDFAPGLSIFSCIVGGRELIYLLRDLSRRIGNGASSNSRILVARGMGIDGVTGAAKELAPEGDPIHGTF